jgi:hypothetical protein
MIELPRYEQIYQDYLDKGFGYASYPDAPDYGISLSDPAWTMKTIEKRDDIRILSYHERGWAAHQDALTLFKLPINADQAYQ